MPYSSPLPFEVFFFPDLSDATTRTAAFFESACEKAMAMGGEYVAPETEATEEPLTRFVRALMQARLASGRSDDRSPAFIDAIAMEYTISSRVASPDMFAFGDSVAATAFVAQLEQACPGHVATLLTDRYIDAF